jgi:putative transposase
MALRCYKYRLYPAKKQVQRLNNQLDMCCELYNTLLQKCKESYEKNKVSLCTRACLNKIIKELKAINPELSTVYSQVLQNVRDRLIKAYSNFFRRIKQKAQGKKIKVGFPRFKKFCKSITYPQNNGSFELAGKKLCISKIGNIPIIFHRPLEGTAKTLTFKRNQAGQWFAVFCCEINTLKQIHTCPDKKVGIDVGLQSFATLSDGTKIENPRFLVKLEAKLANLQKQLARKKKGSKNRIKARTKVAKLHIKITNQRMDFLHKLSRQIVDNYSLIAFEKLNIKAMVKNHCLSHSISDASWNNFIQMLCYKAESAGAELAEVDPRDTSQICSRCGEEVKKSLSVRTHNCPCCRLELDRDLNSAINILKRATAGLAGSYACRDHVRPHSNDLTEVEAAVAEAGTTRVETDAVCMCL